MNFIESLDTATFEILFCADGESPLAAALAARGIEIVEGRPAALSYRRPAASLANIRRQAALLSAWRVDILHAHGFFWATDMVIAAWRLRIPVVLHIQNPAEVAIQNLDRFAAQRILFCSDFEMRNTRRFDRISHKTGVLHNAINTGAIARGTCIRGQLGVKDGELAIGTVAQVSHRKGIDILMETARLLLRERDDLVWLIAGPVGVGEEEFGSRVQALAAEPELKGRVRFLGARSDIPDFLASLDLLVHAARAEPFGIALIEAMAAGVPVIAGNVGGIPEILSTPGIGRLVSPLTPEAFAQAVRETLSLPDRGRSMAAKARLSVVQRFDLVSAGERLKTIYLDVLQAAGQPYNPDHRTKAAPQE